MFEPSTSIPKVGDVVIVYSMPGCGKTTLIAQAVQDAGERGIFVPVVEDGLSPLQKENSAINLSNVNRLPTPISKWNDEKGGLVQLLRWLCSPDQLNKYDVIAIDSINLITSDLEEYCYRRYFVENPDYHGKEEKIIKALAFGFGKSNLIAHMGSEWATVIRALRFLKSHGKKVIVSFHRGTRKVKLVDQDIEFDSYTLDLPVTKACDLAQMVIAEADMVVYGKRDISAAKGNGGKVKVYGGEDRVLVTKDSATVVAKCRFNAPDEIPFSYDELKKYL